MTDHQHPRMQGRLSQDGTGAQQIWGCEIAAPGGPLPGAAPLRPYG